MQQDLLSLLSISKILSIPESTLRYYMRRFSEYVPTIGEGRKKRYRPEAIEVLRTIANMLKNGKAANEIANQLRQRFPINIEVIKEVANVPLTNSLTNIQPEKIENQVAIDALRKVANAIEIMAAYKQNLDETRSELMETKDRLQKIEEELKQLKKSFWKRLFLK